LYLNFNTKIFFKKVFLYYKKNNYSALGVILFSSLGGLGKSAFLKTFLCVFLGQHIIIKMYKTNTVTSSLLKLAYFVVNLIIYKNMVYFYNQYIEVV